MCYNGIMERLKKLEELKSHPWYKKQFSKLRKQDVSLMEDFIKENNQEDRDTFELKVNRFLSPFNFTSLKKSEKSKLLICQELLSCCNS